MRLAGPTLGTRQPLYSATDLVNFLGCVHATALDLEVLNGGIAETNGNEDPYLEILKRKGDEHERAHLLRLKKEGRVIEIDKDGPLDKKVEATLRAMREGADVIYQGALTSPPFHGYSDFLYKEETPSELGGWSYEVVDTKLARTAKPKHVVQLCVYSDLIAEAQGLLPIHAHLILGDGSTYPVKLQDYIHYVRVARDRFLKFVGDTDRRTDAEPCSHCGVCDWADRCEEEWERTEHLSLVAALGRPQAKKLRTAGVHTIRALAELPDDRAVPKLQMATLTRLRSQARLQMHKRTTGENRVEILPLEPRRGFARLPQPNAGDLFFDMEGDPVYSPEGGLEYLFGFHYQDAGADRFTPFWARSRAGAAELRAEIDKLGARLDGRFDTTSAHMDTRFAQQERRLEAAIHTHTRWMIGMWAAVIASQIGLWLRGQ